MTTVGEINKVVDQEYFSSTFKKWKSAMGAILYVKYYFKVSNQTIRASLVHCPSPFLSKGPKGPPMHPVRHHFCSRALSKS